MRMLSSNFGIVMLFLLFTTVIFVSVQGQPVEKIRESEISVTDPSGYAPEELLVQFSSPQTEEKIAKKVEKFYGRDTKKSHKIVMDYSGMGLSNTYLLKLSSGEDPKKVKEKYKEDPEVVYAEPNYIVTVDTVPNDLSPYLWGLHNTGQRGYADADIDAPEAWDLFTGSPEVIVAVIDTGVDYSHPDLAANIWSNSNEIPGNGLDDDHNGYIDDIRGWDFYNRDNNPMDDNNHGTHCAGTIGAVGNNGLGVTGVMWQVRIMPLKFLSAGGSGYTSDAVLAILYANKMGADVISNSWGGTGYSTTLKNAIDASPAVVVCAAGNNARNNDGYPFYPASYSSPQIIAVAASTATDNLASFSNYGGSSVDVAAPGEYIYSTLRGGSYAYMSGTSMATPHVAGLAGLVTAYSPDLTSSQIKDTILTNVDQKSSMSGKILTSGRINAYRTLSSLGVVPVSVPIITSLSPSSTLAGGSGFVLTVTGSNFTENSKVLWNGGQRSTTYVSGTQLRASILSGDIAGTGTASVSVNDPAGGTSNEIGFAIEPKPAMGITSLSPSSAQAGGSGFVLTVTGSNFTENSTVLWNGNQRSTTFLSGTQLRATILTGDIASPGTATVTVTDPSRTNSNGMTFTINGGLQPAVISSVSPFYLRRGGTRSVSIYGSNFAPGDQAELRRNGYTSILCTGEVTVSSGKITCSVPVASTARTGYWNLAVIHPDGQTGIKSNAVYIY
jgi:subtilisin family serine protease